MAKKTFVLAMSLLLTLVLCGVASAKAFTDISVDVPAGWEATEDTDANGAKTVIISNAAKNIKIMVGFESLAGATIKDKATELSTAVGGEIVELEPTALTVNFKDANGVDNIVILSVENASDTRFLGLAVVGANAMQDAEVDAIINSIKVN